MPLESMTGHGASSYNEVSQDHSYETDLGYAIMPVAGRTPKFRRIRLHGGIGYRRVRWKSTRANVPPIIPAATDTPGDLLMSSVVTPSLPHLNPNQAGYNWKVEGEYLYVQVEPRVAGTDTLPTGSFPFAVAPTDTLGSTIITPILETLIGLGTPIDSIADLAMTAAGNLLLDTDGNFSDKFVWPFTSLAPVFSNPALIGG